MDLNSSVNQILRRTPISYIKYAVIKDSNEELVDYKVLDYNDSCINLLAKNDRVEDNEIKDFIFKVQKDIPEIKKSILNSHDVEVVEYLTDNQKWIDILIIHEKDNTFLVQIRDITQEKILERELEKNTEELNMITNTIDDLLVVTDLNGTILLANKSWEKSLGYNLDEVTGSNFKLFLDQTSYQRVEKYIDNRLSFEGGQILRTQMLRKNGEYSTVEWNASVNNDLIYAVGRDITLLVEAQERILYLCYHDKLTGLYNRSFFEEELKRLDNNRHLPLSIIMGDVNGLKITNDAFGHSKGDKLLRKIAGILSKTIRQGDILARWGGDEFAILLPNTDEKTTKNIIERINNACKDNSTLLNHSSISLGYAIKSSVEENIYNILTVAEDKMYKNKAKEGKRFHQQIISSMKEYLRNEKFEDSKSTDQTKSYLKKIANSLYLSNEDLDALLLLADVHDIGLISVPRSILNKKDQLDKSDWDEIKKHSESGYRIAKSIPEIAHIANYILYHHERYDGKGYPIELKGEEIPLLNRIFSIVDVYESLNQNKAYRNSFAQSDILKCLQNNRGAMFDPLLLDLFLDILLEEENQTNSFAN